MRCLVTGVAGFIGSHLAERLLADGHTVIGLDAFTTNYDPTIKRANLAHALAEPGFTLTEGDLAHCDLTPLVDGVDWVFHLAGQPGVRDSWGADFTSYVHNNVQASHRLLDVLTRVPSVRLVYASSSSVYGNAPLPMTETVRPEPVSPYGVTKLTAEHLVGVYSKSHGVQATSLRFFTVYGPRQRPDMAFHRFIRAVANHETIQLYGDGTQTRDFTFVNDIVEACLRAVSTPGKGEVVNVGGGSSVTINDVLDYLGELTGCPVRIDRQPRQLGDAAHTAASVERARSLLGWYPATSWKDGLRQQVEWQIGPTKSRATRVSASKIGPLRLADRRSPRDGQTPRADSRDTAPRILIYGHDTFGLGHLRRNLTIAAGLTRSFPDLSVLLLTGSPVAQNFEFPDNVDYVKLPAVVKVANEDYRARTLQLQPREIIHMRASLIREAILGFAPDVVLVDHAPLGMKGELVPALEALRGRYPRTRIALGLRDVIDEPERVRSLWESQGMNEVLERLYDAVFVYGSPRVLDLTDAYGLSLKVRAKVRHCGYLKRDIPRSDVQTLRASLVPPGERLVVVTAGGGGDGYPLLSAYLRGLAESPLPNTASLVVTGPFMSAPERLELNRQAESCPHVRVTDFTRDLTGLLPAADLVVSMGGYNTLCEILSVGVPSLVVPRVEPRQEQLLRTRAFADLGLVSMLHPDDLVPATLLQHVRTLLDEGPITRLRTRRAIDLLDASGGFDGLATTVEAIADLIGQASPVDARRRVSS